MTSDPSRALRELRDALQNPIPDIDTLVFELSQTLDAIYLGTTSVPPNGDFLDEIKALWKFLPSLQTSLVSSVAPTFLQALDFQQRDLLNRFFVPSRTAATLAITRNVVLTTYQTLPLLFSTTPTTPALPVASRTYVVELLKRAATTYSIDEVYWAIWSRASNHDPDALKTLRWEEAVRAIIGLPAKVANAVGKWQAERWSGHVPGELVPRQYFDNLITRLESLMYELSQSSGERGSHLRIVIQRLGTLGLFNASPTLSSSPQPSFFPAFLPPLLQHLHPPPASALPPYPKSYLHNLISGLPGSTISSLIPSLITHLTFRLISHDIPLQPSHRDERMRRASDTLQEIIGPAEVDSDIWTSVLTYLRNRKGDGVMQNLEQVRSRVVVAWVASGGEKAIKSFINSIIDTWTDPKHVKFALYSQQFQLTHVLLLALSLVPPYHPILKTLSHQSRFLVALQSYLGHPDAGIRRLGMLVAETVSALTIPDSGDIPRKSEKEEIEELKASLEGGEAPQRGESSQPRRLKFGDALWDGDGDGKEECRWLRSCIGVRDSEATLAEDPEGKAWMLGWDSVEAVPPIQSEPADEISHPRTSGRTTRKDKTAKPAAKPKIVMLSEDQLDDPLEGYSVPSPSSSRSPSPTPSYLEEIASDPSLAVDGAQKKTVTRPVYIPQLIALLKDRDKPDSLEMALKWGEDLIRAKRNFGTELTENAVNVALMALALNDPFNLDNFDEQKQGILTALVACAPRQVAPLLAEQYYINQYSLQQKFIILTALAMGARELAGLSVPTPAKTLRRIDFPSKQLPPALHRKYVTEGDIHPSTLQLEAAVDGVRNLLLSKDGRKGDAVDPELGREKRLRVGPSKKTLVAEVGTLRARQADQIGSLRDQPHPPVIAFSEVAAEYFIMPLINRFWQHFQAMSARESRSIAHGGRYRGAGSGLIMSPLALEKFVMTLSILLHAGRHSPAFLAVLAPEALELALTVGLRHPHRPGDDFSDPSTVPEGSKTEAQVLGSALELCLVCLDGSTAQDKGRTLAMDKPQLVIALGEWASGVFEVESKGGMVAGGQAGREGKIRASAAGVVIKISEIGYRWSHLGLHRSR